MDEITIEDKVYVSSKQAAKITGYAKDYVGQLCREGRVEARLVGRNWYVLEDSIREHRFGKPEEVKAHSEAPEIAVDRSSTWQKPQYEAEIPAFVPDLAPKPAVVEQTPAIADMQSAWKEWFEEKKPTQAALPDGSDDFKDEYLPVIAPVEPYTAQEVEEEVEEEPVQVSRIQEPPAVFVEPEEEGEVELHKSYASRETGERIPSTSVPIVDLSQRVPTRRERTPEKKSVSKTSSGVVRALLVVAAITASLIALVGTGNADRLLSGTSFDFGAQKAIVDFLGGKSEYNSSL